MDLKTTFKIAALSTTIVLLTSCGWMPHDVTIKPNLPIKEQNIGNNKTMIVKVSDDRTKNIIGHRTYMKTGTITLNKKQKLAHDIRISIEEGFTKLGFSIIQNGSPDRTVKVDIRLIEYEAVWGFFTVGAFSRGAFEVTCTVPSGKTFVNVYRVEHEHRSFAIPFASTNRNWINEAISESLMRMFDDHSFLEFLKSAN